MHDILRNLQSVTTYLAIQDVDAQLAIGLLELCDESTREAGEQSLRHAFQVNWWTVAGHDDSPIVAEEVVEDVEECLLCALLANPLLNIVDDEQVDGLVEMHKVVERVLAYRVGVLQFEEAGADIEHALLRIDLLHTIADGINKMCLSTSRRSVDKHRVELAGLRMLSDGQSNTTRQFVAIALDEVRESLMRIQLRVEFLWHSGIEHRRRLVGTTLRLLGGSLRLFSFKILREAMLTVGDNTIGQSNTLTEHTPQHLTEKSHIVLLQVLVDEGARYLHQHRLRLLVERFEGDGLEPCVILLLGDILADECECFLPKSIRTFCHSLLLLIVADVCQGVSYLQHHFVFYLFLLKSSSLNCSDLGFAVAFRLQKYIKSS